MTKELTITADSQLFGAIKDLLPNIVDSAVKKMAEDVRVLPDLGITPEEATKQLPSFVRDLYGSEKKVKDTVAYYFKKLPKEETKRYREINAARTGIIGYDLLYGEYTRKIMKSEPIPLEQACIYLPSHRLLDRYTRKYLKHSLASLDNEAFKAGPSKLCPDGKFSYLPVEILFSVQAFKDFDAGYVIMDKALLDMFSASSEKETVIDAGRAIHALACLFDLSILRSFFPVAPYADLLCGKKIPDTLEHAGYTLPPSFDDCFLVFVSQLLSRLDLKGRAGRIIAGTFLQEKVAQALLPSINKSLVIHLIEATKELGMASPQAIDDRDTDSDIVKAIVEVGNTVTEASEKGISCLDEFVEFYLGPNTKPQINHEDIDEAIKAGKAELSKYISKIEESDSLNKINALSADIKAMVGEKQADIELCTKNIKALADQIRQKIKDKLSEPEPTKEENDAAEMVAFLESEATKYEQIIEGLKVENNSLHNTIASLEHKAATPAPAATGENAETAYSVFMRTEKKQLTLADVLQWANEHHKGKLIIHENAIKEGRSFVNNTRFRPIFDRIERLAGNFYDRISNGESINDARDCLGNDFCSDLALKVNSTAIQSKRTFEHNGEDVLCRQYLRIGKDFRIYFAPIETKTGIQLLIGYCGENMQKS